MAEPTVPTVIYDIGSNNGDDIPYYLLKAHKVVAVEANPVLCHQIRDRFPDEISNARLVVENFAITNGEEGVVDFYVHNTHHVLSSLSVGNHSEADFSKISVSSCKIESLVSRHGAPYYMKIDAEGSDEQILESLANISLKPPYISAESHKLTAFALLSERLGYNSFKVVDGRSVSTAYRRTVIASPLHQKYVVYSFPHHSAGPFGNDIFGEWMDKSTLLKVLALQGLGWRDIHASAVDQPTLRF